MTVKKVLCVDDEPIWRTILQMHFQGYLTLNVDFAENYASGLEKIKQNYYNLIILDGLEGDCFRICEDIQTLPHGEVFIFSGSSQIEIEAKKRGISFYSKSRATKFLDEIVDKYSV